MFTLWSRALSNFFIIFTHHNMIECCLPAKQLIESMYGLNTFKN